MRHCYRCPAKVTLIAFCYISTCLKVTITMETTIQTLKETRMPFCIQGIAPVTSLRGISRVDINHSDSLSQSFILDKTLELPKSPLVNPFIVFSCLSDVVQVFHNNNISFIQSTSNPLADFMILQSHKPSPSARDSLELSLSRLCAFRLNLRYFSVMFNPKLFEILSIELIVGGDCNFIDTAVHTKNPTLLVRIYGAFCGECKCEIIFFIRASQKTLNNLPVKILQGIIGNLDRNLNSAPDSRDTQDIIFERKTSRRIVSNRSSFNKGFCLGFFNHSTGLFDTGNRQLRRKPKSSQIGINKRMEFDIISNSHFPSLINTELKPLLIEFNSSDNQIINFQFYGNRPNQHQYSRNSNYLNLLEGISPPKAKAMGIRDARFI